MTNLSLIDGRTIAMGNRQQLNSGLDKVKNTTILRKIKLIFFQHFEQAVDDCCMRIDVEFGLQLGKNREKMNKEQYIKLLEYLRSVRRDIKQDYLLKVNEFFDDSDRKAVKNQKVDFSNVLLISGDAVKEGYAVTAIIRQCEHLFYEELTSLNKLMAIQPGKQTIANSQNSIVPEKLVRALVEVVKPLKLNADGRIVLYKTFEVAVFSQLGFIYRELIKQCEADVIPEIVAVEPYSGVPMPAPLYVVGEIKENAKPASESAEQISAEFTLLQEKLELWRWAHFPSAYDSISVTGHTFYQHFEIKYALQVLQQFNDDTEPSENKQPLKWQVLKKLKELSFSIDDKILAKQDEDVLDLVALIFSEINKDESLQGDVKTAILQLEIPFSVASLGRYGIFFNPQNPVRQLLDDMFAAGRFLNAEEYEGRLIQQRIASTVKKITRDSGFELSGWTAEASEFSLYLSKQKQYSQNLEETAKELMINEQALRASRKIVAITIENSLMGKKVPTAIVEFLHDVWSDVLLDAYTGKDELPEQWEKTVQAMDELIVSVMPPADDHQRKQILTLLPGLIAALRKGLKQISYDKPAQARFFKDLAVWHIILMDKKETKKTLDDVSEQRIKDEKIKAVTLADDSSEQARNLAVDSWVAFSRGSATQWGKLIWKDAENRLFSGKNGVKMFEIRIDALAEKLRYGQAAIVILDQKTISERVLSELMSL
ncbi:MAG: DUF1631 family protein [Methylobacter sp.]|uniref:DUF1631 family protein n=1 Tax=Candidatus Methylobacter titanis TaxID=3053457 RepID=A0AA43Q206_9GAMM|nr:DUF1631 family protein [Candidatus Methylobacter titanis]